jgi:Zn-dependent peptidase ImmA (M78 family)
MVYKNPAHAAESLIDEYCFTSPQDLNIEELAFAEQLVVKDSPSENFYGRLMHNKDSGIITIGSKVRESGARSFTIAHELGHFLLERNFSGKSAVGFGLGFSTCIANDVMSFKTSKLREDKANEFAAELLMYKPWFCDYVRKRDINIELIKELAEYFKVSLTAAAIRYTELGRFPTAVIYSRNGAVQWHFPSPYFPVKYIPKGYTVKKEAGAYDAFNNNEVQMKPDMVPAQAWYAGDFNCTRDLYLWEQNVVMRNYDAVITLLWEVKL